MLRNIQLLLRQAEIDPAELPSDFCPATLARDLESASLKHAIRTVGDGPAANKADVAAIEDILSATKRVRVALAAVGGELRERARWALNEAIADSDTDDVDREQGRSSPGSIAAVQQCIKTLEAAAATAARRLRTLSSEGALLPGSANEGSALQHLVTVSLPHLYHLHIGRDCGWAIEPARQRPTECIRFVVAAAEAIGIQITPEAVLQHHKRSVRAKAL